MKERKQSMHSQLAIPTRKRNRKRKEDLNRSEPRELPSDPGEDWLWDELPDGDDSDAQNEPWDTVNNESPVDDSRLVYN